MKFIKKHFLKFIILLLVSFIFILSINCFTVQADNHKIDSTSLSEVETADLVQIIIDKELLYINLFSDEIVGIEKFKINNDYYIELTNRNDNLYVINNMLVDEQLNENQENKLLLLRNLLDVDNDEQDNINLVMLERNNDYIYTPNGSIVQFAFHSVNTIDENTAKALHLRVLDLFTTLTDDDCLAPATNSYNCHSYAWYSQDVDENDYWIRYPISYMDDDSYEEVFDVRPGDILCYWSYGSNDMYGEELFCEYISHSAIITNINPLFDLDNASTLEYIDLVSKWGMYGLYTHNGDECPYGSRDRSFQFVKAYRPRINSTYTLNNYSSTINDSLIVDTNTPKIDSYKMYELHVNYTKNYEFRINSNNALDVRLYDEHMQLIDVLNLNSGLNYVHFIEKLYITNIYYLRVAYNNEENIGTINIKIVSRTTAYIGVGSNDILLNSHNYNDGIYLNNYYYYINNRGVGFYKFTLIGIKTD